MLLKYFSTSADGRPRIFLGWSVSAKCNFMLHSEEVEGGQTDGQQTEGLAREVG